MNYSQLGNYAWIAGNANSKAQIIGQKLPNPWGVYDMYGNVWEYAYDWYGAYNSNSKIDPTGPVNGTRRVSRGGSWHFALKHMRSADRISEYYSFSFRGYFYGFRLVLVADPTLAWQGETNTAPVANEDTAAAT